MAPQSSRSSSGQNGGSDKEAARQPPDEVRFLKSWLENPGRTGAVSPSGPGLAREMASRVDVAAEGPIIELGPGTGPVTQALLARGIDPKRLILVEYSEAFCALLEERFAGVTIIQGDAYRLAETLKGVLTGPAAAVVSSLPLLNMPEPQRLDLVADAFDLMRPQGRFIQFTYGLVSPVPMRGAAGRDLLIESQTSSTIWLNLPPARVWIYRRVTRAQ